MNDLFLVSNDAAQQLYIFLYGGIRSQHHRIPFSPHTDGDHMFKIFVPLHTIFPVAVKPLTVCIVIPVLSVPYVVLLGLHLIPLFTGTHQRLMVGLPDGDPQFRTEFYDSKRILRTIQRQGCRPHRRPEIISFQTQ